MAKFNSALLAFNRGLVSDLALARVDLKRLGLSAEVYDNWMPRTLGPMMLRPGLRYIGATQGNQLAEFVPFVFSVSDTALIELTPGKVRVWVDEALVTRAAVSTAVTNGTFNTDLTGWTDTDEAGGTSVWATGGYMSLTGNGTNAGSRSQTLTVALADQNVEHALNIVTYQGICQLRVGSSSGADDLISETTLGVGSHSLAFTPTGGSVYIEVFNRNSYASLIDSIVIAPAGVMEITVPWVSSTFDKFRCVQSGDVIFVSCEEFQQKRIERRGPHSWSTVWYRPVDGPFRNINISPIRMTPSAISGNIALTASKPYFKSTNVGSLFRLTSTGQQVAATITSQDQWTDPIKVTGVGTGRTFALIVGGLTGTGTTVKLQRSVEAPGAWSDVASYTTNQSTSFTDGLDNQIIYYRIGVDVGGYSTGTITAQLTYSAGSISGICRITGFTSSTVVSAEVVKNLGGVSSTDDWEEGAWSDRRGWPSAVALHEGRMWWAGKDKVWGSVSDAYESFDSTIEGDSGPISRSVGQGPVDTINWMMSVNRLLIGGQMSEFSAQSNSVDEPLTPTNFNLKAISTQGSKRVPSILLDNNCVFVQRGGARVFEVMQQDQFSGFQTNDLTVVIPGIGKPGITRIGVQRQPDTRIHCVRSDGTVAILVYDDAEQVRCWINFSTDGAVESVVTLPGGDSDPEDRVYYVVKRTINGSTVRYLERWAIEDDCQGGLLNKQADSHIVYDGVATTTITGLSHLEGETVVVWADGADVGTKVVASGQITLGVAASKVVVGLGYTAKFKSAKLAYTSEKGTPLNQLKRVHHLGVILKNTHHKGLKYGRDFDNLWDMPDSMDWATVATGTIHSSYDQMMFEFDGEWNTDSRICLQASAPRPCTILAAVIGLDQSE